MRETAPEMVGDRFGDPFGKNSDKVQKCCQSCSKSGLENMELDGFWVVVAPFWLRLAVVRGTGPKFHYRPLFGHIGHLGPKTDHFLVLGSLRVSGQSLAYCPLGPWALLGPVWGPTLGLFRLTPTNTLPKSEHHQTSGSRMYPID